MTRPSKSFNNKDSKLTALEKKALQNPDVRYGFENYDKLKKENKKPTKKK